MGWTDADVIRLADALRAAGADSIDVETGSARLRIVVAARQPEPSDREARDGTTVFAPCCGRFIAGSASRPKTFAAPGVCVAKDDVLGLIAVGPVREPVLAPHAGVVQRFLVSDGDKVEFGTPILLLERQGSAG